MVWGGRWEGGSGLGTRVHPWQMHVDVWQNQYNIVKYKWHDISYFVRRYSNFPSGSDSKVSAYNVGNPGSILGSGRSPGEGNGNPLQYSCLENPMDRGTW